MLTKEEWESVRKELRITAYAGLGMIAVSVFMIFSGIAPSHWILAVASLVLLVYGGVGIGLAFHHPSISGNYEKITGRKW